MDTLDTLDTTAMSLPRGERRRRTARFVRRLISRDRDVAEYASGAYAILFGTFAHLDEFRAFLDGGSDLGVLFGLTLSMLVRAVLVVGGMYQLWAVWNKLYTHRRATSLAATATWSIVGAARLHLPPQLDGGDLVFFVLAFAAGACYIKLGRPAREGGEQ